MKSRSAGVSRDELFIFEAAPIQLSLKATFNNKWVSIKQGVDLSANQNEHTTQHETFQFEYHEKTKDWTIMTHDCSFWSVANGSSSSTVHVSRQTDNQSVKDYFNLVWSENDATCSLKLSTGSSKQLDGDRWICARKSGQLYLGAGNATQEPVRFIMRFQNRRSLNLRPVNGSGFVGLKTNSSGVLEANKTAPDSILVEYTSSDYNVQQSLLPTNNLTSISEPHVKGITMMTDLSGSNLDSNNNTTAAFENQKEENEQTIETATPSVAAIINSLSNAHLNNNNNNYGRNNLNNITSIHKIAPSINLSDGMSDTASVVSSSSPLGSGIAQYDCCYLKMLSKDRYWTVGDNGSSIMCDSTSRACAQQWIIELRTHSAIAIRTNDTHAYVQLGSNGTIGLAKCDAKDASLWEI